MEKYPNFELEKCLESKDFSGIDVSLCPSLNFLVESFKDGVSEALDGIYRQSDEVAKIKAIPYADPRQERIYTEKWIGTTIPIVSSNHKKKEVLAIPDCAIAAMGVKILNMILKGEPSEKIVAMQQAYDFFIIKDLSESSPRWIFTPEDRGLDMDEFVNIMKIK